MEEMTYLINDMINTPDKYKGEYGKKIKHHMENYNSAYYYGLERQKPIHRARHKGQLAWNERTNKMKSLLEKI